MELISKEALIKRLKEWNTNDSMDKALYNFALNRVIEQPTVEAVPVVHGEWTDDQYVWECNKCGSWFEVTQCRGEMNFCPNCGADMRKKV